MKMKDLNPEERPREKMMVKGPEGLSNGELLAILIQSGTKEDSALDIARKLLNSAGNSLTGLYARRGNNTKGRTNANANAAIKGLGPKKMATITAALELGRRFFEENINKERKALNEAKDVIRLMLPAMKGLTHEECWVVHLNTGNIPIGKEMLTQGDDSSTTFDIKQTIRSAISAGASGIILIHNHPSGNPRPSIADIKHTKALHKACESVGLRLLDHIVMSDGAFYSFSEESVL